jgi:acetyl-CoA acetyltransferase
MQSQKAGNEVQHDFDDGVRPATPVEKLATLDTLVPNGRITAGNASQIRWVRDSFDIQTRA